MLPKQSMLERFHCPNNGRNRSHLKSTIIINSADLQWLFTVKVRREWFRRTVDIRPKGWFQLVGPDCCKESPQSPSRRLDSTVAEIKVKDRVAGRPTVVDRTGVEFSSRGLGGCILEKRFLTARPTGDVDDWKHGVGWAPGRRGVDQFPGCLVVETTPQIDAEYEETLRRRITDLTFITHIRWWR